MKTKGEKPQKTKKHYKSHKSKNYTKTVFVLRKTQTIRTDGVGDRERRKEGEIVSLSCQIKATIS
jgi:hypothetical protein